MGFKSTPSAHDILDGDIHTDSAAAGVTRGSLIHGNSTPAWAELTVGDASDILGTDGTDVLWRTLAEAGIQAAGAGGSPSPGGRLCLTTATPVHASDAADQTTLFYTPYIHDLVPMSDGSTFTATTFTELSIVMNADTDWAADSNYDVYIADDSGTMRLCTGTAWTNDTTRSAAISRLKGVYVNDTEQTARYGATDTFTMTAKEGLYVGTMRTTGTAGTTTMEFGGEASGGDPGVVYVWNMYNRRPITIAVLDNDNSWTYTSITFRSKNNSTGNRVTMVRGLDEDMVHALEISITSSSVDNFRGRSAVGIDSTTTPSGLMNNFVLVANVTAAGTGGFTGAPGLGLHFLQAIESSQVGSGNVQTFYGDIGVTFAQSGMQVILEA